MVDELVGKLADILTSEFVHSDEGMSAEQLMAAVGAPQQSVFDFSAMSRLLTQSSVKTPLPEARRRRIEWLLSVLKEQRFFPEGRTPPRRAGAARRERPLRAALRRTRRQRLAAAA